MSVTAAALAQTAGLGQSPPVPFGEGNVGIEDCVRKFIALCPGRAISREVIVMQRRPHRIFDPKFW